MEINNRLRLIRENNNESQQQFAKHFKMAQNTYGQYEIGKRAIPDEFKSQLAKLGINLHWLITGEGSMFIEKQTNALCITPGMGKDDRNPANEAFAKNRDVLSKDPDIYVLPVTNLNASTDHEEYLDTTLPIPRRLAAKFGDLIAAMVRGDSMEPTIRDGEPVAIEKNNKFDCDGIYAISILGELFVKRISIDRLKNKVTIISDNPKYPMKDYDLGIKGFDVIGKVVFWVHVE